MTISYLVTTQASDIPNDSQIVMINGTVPGWKGRMGDLYYDHRSKSLDVQIQDLMFTPSINPNCQDVNFCFVTTQSNAAACCAAAWMQLSPYERQIGTIKEKFLAISYDCDYLAVPASLSRYAHLAAQVVATLKVCDIALAPQLLLPIQAKNWTWQEKQLHASLSFQLGTKWLIDAALGLRSWPGELGEGKLYWEEIEEFAQQLHDQERVSVYNGALLFNGKRFDGEQIDLRCWIKAAKLLDFGECGLFSVTNGVILTQEDIYFRGEFKGYSYKLDRFPSHPNLPKIDYVKSGAFLVLTYAERKLGSDQNSWGGCKNYGCFDWKSTSSNLSPEQVIDIVLKRLGFD